MSQLIHLHAKTQSNPSSSKTKTLFFSRDEFSALVGSYSMRVAEGVWKDYAIDSDTSTATFSIFRHSFEMPLFAVTKKRNGKHYEFALLRKGHILKRSRSLHDLLALFANPVWLKKHS